jgi:hypothetical protein
MRRMRAFALAAAGRAAESTAILRELAADTGDPGVRAELLVQAAGSMLGGDGEEAARLWREAHDAVDAAAGAAGAPDAGAPDAGAPDAAAPDAAGPPDAAAAPDAAGPPDAAAAPDAAGPPDAAAAPDAAGPPDAPAAGASAALAAERALRADLAFVAAARALDAGDLSTALAEIRAARRHALAGVAVIQYLAAAIAESAVAELLGDDHAAYGSLATGYATLGDVVGRALSASTFDSPLRTLRDRWGADRFARAKRAYDRSRRSVAEGGDDERRRAWIA